MTVETINASDRVRRLFNRRYTVALVLLAAAACVSFGLSYRMSMVNDNRSAAYNLVHAQRTDSQRIAFVIKSIEADPASQRVSALRDELRTTVNRMRETHEMLVGRSSDSRRIKRFIKPLQKIYFAGEQPFDDRIRFFLENAATITHIDPTSEEWQKAYRARQEVISAATDTMLQTHGLMTLILDAESERTDEIEKALNILAWLATLALLAAITLIIFRPMVGHILKAIREMEEAQKSAVQAEQAATVANEAKGYFFQAASHELKTPLNAILGMTDAIRGKGDLGIDEELEQVIEASDHLLSLLNNILDTHRLSDGPLSLDNREFQLKEILQRPVGRLARLAEAKGITFNHNIDIDGDFSVLGDPQRLEQVIFNLLDNAVKFTTEGEINIDACVLSATAGLSLALAVKDTGIGISDKQITTVFDQMSGEAPQLARNGGLGVGLALVKAIVTSMGGSVDVSSTEGQGTTINVALPLTSAEAEFEAGDEPRQVHAGAKLTPLPIEGEEGEQGDEDREIDILIVDDNMANRMVAEALVKPMGARTVMAADGREALDRATEQKFDLVFMDISMPVMDGVKATQLIREGDGPNRETPVIALTAHVGPGEWSGLGQVGFNDILNKPVRKDVIQKCVEKWVRRPVVPTENAA